MLVHLSLTPKLGHPNPLVPRSLPGLTPIAQEQQTALLLRDAAVSVPGMELLR